jgi:hypothetical protein
MNNIKQTYLWKFTRNNYYKTKILYDTYVKSIFTNSYAQFREDTILDRFFKKSTGFYIDIGANHPDRFSNTKKFYKKGWSGINIEPNPVSFKKIY